MNEWVRGVLTNERRRVLNGDEKKTRRISKISPSIGLKLYLRVSIKMNGAVQTLGRIILQANGDEKLKIT